MKKLILILLFSVFVCINGVSGDLGLPHITVYGEAKDLVTPDQMVWNLHVRNRDKTLNAVADYHKSAINEVVDLLLQNGIEEGSIRTSNMQLGDHWEYRNGVRLKEGFFASSVIVFTTDNLKLYESLWMGLASLNNLEVLSVRYELSDRSAYLNQIRGKALADARNKAETMAAALDAEIGEPMVIEEISGQDCSPVRQRSAVLMEASRPAGQSDQPMSMPGKIDIDVSVRVTFRLITVES